MTYEVNWGIEGHVIINKYIGHLDAEHLATVLKANVKLMAGINNPVHFITDCTELTGVNPNFSRVSDVIKYTHAFMSHPNIGFLLAYGVDNQFLKFFGSIIVQHSQKDLQILNNYNECIDYLIRRNPSLTTDLRAMAAKMNT